jgi:hypothetical protein
MYPRDSTEKILVVGGPFDGRRMAREGDEFRKVIGSKKSCLHGKFTYRLRWHPKLKRLVWALPENKNVSYPK